MRDDKVEMVKRIIRQNNYHQYEKTHNQCMDLGLNVNRSALDRFANKLELIDKAILSKRQQELHQLEEQEKKARKKSESQHSSKAIYQQSVHEDDFSGAEMPTHQPVKKKPTPARPVATHSQGQSTQSNEMATRQNTPASVKRKPHSMTYEQVKQRETEITFALGELKIKENELLQELITLTEMLDSNQVN